MEGRNGIKGTVQQTKSLSWISIFFVLGPLLDAQKINDLGLIFAEIFVFENQLPAIVYYEELMLCEFFTTQSL